ncbi:glycosyltransferase [Pontimicrobium sp. SW4]|uniref:Glycosyltransferase n=1 Tax=Pontimicrobium sp. SW4 TaxID=3153519 RepID=A0AAU7BQE5_9FLAO
MLPKLLYITTNLQGSGGVSRLLSVKLNYLIENYGYNIYVITTNNKSNTFFYEFNNNIKFHKIDIKDFGFWHLRKYKQMLQSIINDVKPDIIINCDNGFKGTLLPLLIKSNASLVYERHGSRQIKTKTFVEYLKKKTSNFVIDQSIKKYQVFAVSNDDDRKDWKSNNVKLIYNPIWFKPPLEDPKFDNKIVLAVGRHSVEKQFDLLLKIWQKVVKDNPDWTLKIFGESDNEKTLKTLVKKLEIGTQVELHPPTKNITAEYANASMLLNASSSEAFGLVIIEAMAYGLPAIAFESASGPKMLIDNDANGYLIKSFDIDAYANKVKQLIDNKILIRELSKNAKKSVKKFDIDVIMKQWHQLFQSIGE